MIRRLRTIALLAAALLPAVAGLLAGSCKGKATQPSVDPSKLVILKASWTSLRDGTTVDVTKLLAGMVKDNALTAKATSQVLGDPAPFQLKSLTVEYEKGGVFARKHVDENGTLEIPLAERPKPIRVVVRKAVWGDLAANKTVDVTRQVSNLVNGDGLRLTPTVNLLGDPVSFQAKELRVDYEFDHAPKTKTVREKQELVISPDSP